MEAKAESLSVFQPSATLYTPHPLPVTYNELTTK